jgi:signal transduction histidine kinase
MPGEKSPALVDGLSDSLKLLDSLTQELRTVSHLLHPPHLEDSGLAAALRQYTEGLFDRSGLVVHLQIDPNLRRLPRDVEATVFRIVQEALTNVHKHANAETATVQISSDANLIEVAVEDHGIGIPGFLSLDSPNIKLGVGIQGMRERVRYLNGSFSIRSNTGGTIVSATLPAMLNEGQNGN